MSFKMFKDVYKDYEILNLPFLKVLVRFGDFIFSIGFRGWNKVNWNDVSTDHS